MLLKKKVHPKKSHHTISLNFNSILSAIFFTHIVTKYFYFFYKLRAYDKRYNRGCPTNFFFEG